MRIPNSLNYRKLNPGISIINGTVVSKTRTSLDSHVPQILGKFWLNLAQTLSPYSPQTLSPNSPHVDEDSYA